MVGTHFAAFFTDDDVSEGKPLTELTIARNAGVSEDMGWRVRRDGKRFWAETTLTALRDDHGLPRGFVHIVRDLSERRRVQELETEGQRINEFIAMLAHELRNPLAPIGNAVAIIERVADTPELVWCAQLIGRQVGHLARLVDDLLDVGRITSGKILLRREPVDLSTIVSAAIESVRPLMVAYAHELDVMMPGEPMVVQGDATRLTQVVVNLLTNAAKYTPNGGLVRLRLETRGTLATLRVSDNGIGMSKQLMESAFNLFVQGERTLDRAEGGLGIGLTLVKRLVALHGGIVSVASAGFGQGSEFTVRLPMAAQASATTADKDTVPSAD